MVKAKKALGQHFLKEEGIARKIAESLLLEGNYGINGGISAPAKVLEIGPGTGVLTKYLLNREDVELFCVEIDNESVEYLKVNYPMLGERLIEGDFLKMDLKALFPDRFLVIGNLPYNISSQIFFKLLDYREMVPQIVCMLQKEVAKRLASPPGNKDYGILSVLLQAWYDIDYLFTVDEGAFIPPPKVKSGVIRVVRNSRISLNCDESQFKQVVKCAFNQRRKTIRNSVRSLFSGPLPEHHLLSMRPEQLSVEEFIELTKLIFPEK